MVDALCGKTVDSPVRGTRVVDFVLLCPSFLTQQGLVATACTTRFNIYILPTVLFAFFTDPRKATISVNDYK